MKYIIVVDKQTRTNPSTEKIEIPIEIDELRKKGNKHDDLIIENSKAKIIRRIGITPYHVTYILDKEEVENIGEVKIPLFQGNNYIYIKDQYNNQMCAEYIIKNDFTDMYVTNLQMSSAIEQTAQSIDLSVDKKLSGYSTTKQMQSAINMRADSIELSVNQKLENYDTSEETSSKIAQKANEITSTVSSTYATKAQLNTAKSEIKQTTDSIIQSVTAIKDNTVENIINGDFKNEFNNWTKSSAGIMSIETINNTKWLYMGVYAQDAQDSISQKITTLIKNTQYRLSFNAYHAVDSDGVINVEIGFYNSSDVLLSNKTALFYLSTSEQNYNWEFSTPNSFSYVILKFWAIGHPNKDMYFKDISVIGGALWQRVTQLQLSVDGIQSEVSEKVGNDELSTKIQHNAESIQIAWNKISEFIQFINAQLQIKDSNKKLLMALDKEGFRFYNNNLFTGKIGATQYKEDHNQKGLAFNLDENGKFMCWGVISADKSSYNAKLWYNSANSFGREREGIYLGTNLNLNGYKIVGKVIELSEFEESNWSDGGTYYGFDIDDNISNIASFTRREAWFNGDIYSNGYQVLTNTSDGRLKKEIYSSTINALDIISQLKHRQFIWKKDDVHENIGYIAQELKEIDSNYVNKNPQYDEDGNVIDYTYQVNLLPIVATATKAIQELNSKVEEQKQTIEKQQQFINLLVEKLNMQEEYNNIFNTVSTRKARKARAKKEQEVVFDGEIQFTRRKKINRKHKIIKQYNDGRVEIVEEEEKND